MDFDGERIIIFRMGFSKSAVIAVAMGFLHRGSDHIQPYTVLETTHMVF